MKALIQKLVEAWGPSGYEHQVRALIQDDVAELADEITVDPLGNLICRIGTGGTKVMIDAHMDEIGLMATYQEPESGYLRFVPIGGLLHNTLVGHRVRFENGITGVIGVHDTWGSGRRNLPELDQFYIDVSDGSDTSPVEVGSPATLWRPYEERGTRLISKAMDDRIGCAIAIETMRRVKAAGTPNTLYFVFAVQEEVGLRGATTAAYGVDPHVGIALDVTRTGDEPKNSKMAVKLGAGTAIKMQDPGLIVPPQVRDWMVETAQAQGIPYQREVLAGGSTDAARIQLARAGVPSGVISIPTRFIHTTSETVDLRDVQASVDLLTALVSAAVPFAAAASAG